VREQGIWLWPQRQPPGAVYARRKADPLWLWRPEPPDWTDSELHLPTWLPQSWSRNWGCTTLRRVLRPGNWAIH